MVRWKEKLTETSLKGLYKPHNKSGAFRDLLEHFSHLVMTAANQTGLVNALNVVTNLFFNKKLFKP